MPRVFRPSARLPVRVLLHKRSLNPTRYHAQEHRGGPWSSDLLLPRADDPAGLPASLSECGAELVWLTRSSRGEAAAAASKALLAAIGQARVLFSLPDPRLGPPAALASLLQLVPQHAVLQLHHRPAVAAAGLAARGLELAGSEDVQQRRAEERALLELAAGPGGPPAAFAALAAAAHSPLRLLTLLGLVCSAAGAAPAPDQAIALTATLQRTILRAPLLPAAELSFLSPALYTRLGRWVVGPTSAAPAAELSWEWKDASEDAPDAAAAGGEDLRLMGELQDACAAAVEAMARLGGVRAGLPLDLSRLLAPGSRRSFGEALLAAAAADTRAADALEHVPAAGARALLASGLSSLGFLSRKAQRPADHGLLLVLVLGPVSWAEVARLRAARGAHQLLVLASHIAVPTAVAADLLREVAA